jgi:hypothetical protein
MLALFGRLVFQTHGAGVETHIWVNGLGFATMLLVALWMRQGKRARGALATASSRQETRIGELNAATVPIDKLLSATGLKAPEIAELTGWKLRTILGKALNPKARAGKMVGDAARGG